MEKTKLIKIFLVVLVSVMLVFVATSTYADDEPVQFVDVTNNSAAPSNTNTNSNSNSNSNSNNTNTNNTNTNSNTNLIANTSNSSNYNNNANLPKTGVAETGSVICIAFALAVSAGYAYKKLRDYNV